MPLAAAGCADRVSCLIDVRGKPERVHPVHQIRNRILFLTAQTRGCDQSFQEIDRDLIVFVRGEAGINRWRQCHVVPPSR